MDIQSTPWVGIDLEIAEKNIRQAVEHLGKYHVAHRPHIKVHKSLFFAKKQQEMGCKGITCAKLGEAEVMAEGGISDILIAYPLIGKAKLERYKKLVQCHSEIRTIINSWEGAKGLSELGESLGKRLPVLIELDGGINRGGVKLGEPLEEFGKQIKTLAGIRVEGIEYYGGDIYGCKTGVEIKARAARERDEILEGGKILNKLGYDIRILSGGSSFSILFPEELEGLTEVRAGNYIFNDCALLSIGMISENSCAMEIRSMVVARPDTQTAIIDAGSKTLTSDRVNYREGYGYVKERPEAIITKLNEEHGFVYCPEGIDWRIGDQIHIIPNHACVVPNLCDYIFGMRNGIVEHLIAIEARGKNY